jgi:putative tryptophan/tyrosine transport system substrate-binding protein
MRDLGYVEGENIVIEGRYYGDRLDRVPAFAAELARSQVDVIVAAASPAPEAARRFLQNPTIPLDLKELEVAAPAPSSSSPAPCSSPTERGSRS